MKTIKETKTVKEIMTVDHNCIDQHLMKQIREPMAPTVKYLLAFILIVETVLGIISFIHNSPYTFVFFLLDIFFIFYYFLVLNWSVKTSFLQKKVFKKNKFLEYRLIFDEEKITYVNKEIKIPVKYTQIKKIIEVDSCYIFITRTIRYFVCEKKKISPDHENTIRSLAKRFAIPYKNKLKNRKNKRSL